MKITFFLTLLGSGHTPPSFPYDHTPCSRDYNHMAVKITVLTVEVSAGWGYYSRGDVFIWIMNRRVADY